VSFALIAVIFALITLSRTNETLPAQPAVP